MILSHGYHLRDWGKKNDKNWSSVCNKTSVRKWLEQMGTANMKNKQHYLYRWWMWNAHFKFSSNSIFDWPWRFIQGNSANVEFLNLIDGSNSQSAVVGQSQTVMKNAALVRGEKRGKIHPLSANQKVGLYASVIKRDYIWVSSVS